MRTVGAKIGLVAALLLIVGSSLVWDSVLRGGRAEPLPRGDRFVVFEHGGPPVPAPARARRVSPPPERPAAKRLPAPAPAPAPKPPPEPERPRTWTVTKGQSLSEIADRVYGESRRWPEIARANGIEDPDLIREGQVLRIP
ncbi:MAG: LysM peptidoglycan-binding domain-containing protein [Planctomycetota bacterium]